jgi:molybdopterin-guanine dinucleotide biosynthesis protein A
MSEPLAAIVLAGGRASRLGGIDKPALELEGASLLARAVAATHAVGAAPVVVGPERPGVEAEWVREEPPFGGPVAAIAAALPRVGADWTLVLAADLVHPDDVVAALVTAAPGEDGCLLADADGHPQWLCGLYRTEALRGALVGLGDTAGASMRALLGSLRLVRHPVASPVVSDIDTPDDARAAGIDSLAS